MKEAKKDGKMISKKNMPNVNVEIKKIENLKGEIREKFSLGDNGLAFKIMTHNSPYGITYEKINGTFFDTVSNLLKGADLGGVIKRLRK